MSEVFLGRGKSAKAVQLGRLLGEGASGEVHALSGKPGTAAKLYHDTAEAKRYEAKVDAMLARPPELPPAEHDGVHYPQIAWPEAKLYDKSGRFVGFTMPEIDFARSTSLVNLLQKSSRRAEQLSEYYGYRVLVARNFASVFAELHRAGHHMIDMKPANLRFYPAVSWMAVVDTDGFSIQGKGSRLPAAQVSDEYIAPESWQKRPVELGVEQDLFALAVIIFQLLNNGLHPFAGGQGGKRAAATDLQGRIQAGLYPYGVRADRDLMPAAASVHRMFPRETRVLFDQAFVGKGPRPNAAAWRDHLDALVCQLEPCEAKPGEHAHFGAGCGFCGHEARVEAAVRTAPVRPKPIPKATPMRGGLPMVPPPRRVPPPPGTRPAGRRGQVWVQLPKGKRRNLGRGLALALGAVLLLASSDLFWDRVGPPREAAAAPAVAKNLPEPEITPFSEPRSYQILPGEGMMTVMLRQGPGDRYPLVDRLRMHEPVVGRGESRVGDGNSWVWITRNSDGVTGFVPSTALLEREKTPSELARVEASDCKPGTPAARTPSCSDPEVAAVTRALTDRYRKLLARADTYDRVDLTQGQQLWEDQRRHCEEETSDPVPCLRDVNARRLEDLETWIAADRATRKPASQPAADPDIPSAADVRSSM